MGRKRLGHYIAPREFILPIFDPVPLSVKSAPFSSDASRLRLAEPKPARRAQVALTPRKCGIRLEERVIAFPSHLAAEIIYHKTFLVHKGNNVG